jgi:hypothetical protein
MRFFTLLFITFFVLIIFQNFTISQSFKSNYYYLGEVFDARETKSNAIGLIYSDLSPTPNSYYLDKGIKSYLKEKLESVFIYSRDPYFVNLALQKLSFSEKSDSQKIIYGQFEFKGSFYITTGQDSITIFPFKYSVKYRRKPSERDKLEDVLKSKLIDLNINLEKWFEKNYAKNYFLARHVTVKTTDFTPNFIDSDTLYFFQRKVKLDDFLTVEKRKSKYSGQIFTSMGYQSTVRMSNDTVYLNMEIKVYQIKGMSWIIEEAKTKYVLDHEQTHFNISQLVAEKFKQHIKDEAITPTDYDSRIQYLYIEYFRKIYQLQSQYDSETEHGLNKNEQGRWEKYIDEELKKFGVFIEKIPEI